MKFRDVPKSPVFEKGRQWKSEPRKGLYESEITAMIRDMLDNESIREDQRFAWDRWRDAGTPTGKE